MRARGGRRDKSHPNPGLKPNGHLEKTTPKDDSTVEPNTVESYGGSESDIFPRCSPWVVCAVTMAVRIHYVCQPRNWWILHPDEIYQTLEVAHSEVYGYGFRSHEYLSGDGDGHVTQMRQSEIQIGMHSMRSFLLPRFYILVTWFAESLGYQGQPFLIWRVAHVVVSSCLPLAVYKFSKTIFRSRDISVISAILTAVSTQLTVFGTHTLVNSFIGTPLFFGLAFFLENMMKDGHESKAPDFSDNHNRVGRMSEDEELNNFKTYILSSLSIRKILNEIRLCYAEPGRCRTNAFHHTPDIPVGSEDQLYNAVRDANMNVINKEDVITTPASNLTSVGAFYTRSAVFLSVLIITTCCYIRVDSSLFVLLTSLCFVTRKWFTLAKMASSLAGLVVGVYVGVTDDFRSYGFGVISPYNWFQFNVVRDLSAIIYGRMDWAWYLTPMFYDNPFVTFLAVVTFCTFVAYGLTMKSFSTEEKRNYISSLKVCAIVLLILAIYSTKGHKEHRFLYNILVLLFIVFSHCIYSIANAIQSRHRRCTSQYVVVFIVFIFGLSQWINFPSSHDGSVKSWTYVGNTQSHDVITCFDYISKQNDVRGVFNDNMLHMSGGYSVLHKDVPILSLVHFEFYEFDRRARTSLSSADLFKPGRDISVSTFTQTSEFVSVQSMPYLIKLLISRKQYNYIVFNTDKQFLPYGVTEVFRSGSKRVLKWNPDEHQERQLDLLVSKIPLGTNATVLTYEADWLIKFKQFKLAKARLVKAIEVEPRFVEAYKLFALCYTLTGDERSSAVVMGQCMKHHSKQTCYDQPNKIHLHSAYKFSL